MALFHPSLLYPIFCRGKTAQRSERIQQLFMMAQEELDEFLFRAQSDVLSWQLIDSNILYMRAQKKGSYAPPNRIANCIVGGTSVLLTPKIVLRSRVVNFLLHSYVAAYVTSLGRAAMQKAFCKIHAAKGLLVYTDTDSIVFMLPKGVPIPLPISNIFGEFKHELGRESKILAFSCLGVSDKFCLLYWFRNTVLNCKPFIF